MNRRDFLAKFSKTAAAVGVSTTAVAAGLHAKSKAAAADGADLVRARVETLEQRIDRLDTSQRRILRILAITISVSTGIDIATLL